MFRARQLHFPGFSKGPHRHGGDLRQGKRKTARPFDRKQALHVVLKSSKARGRWSMLSPKHARAIHGLVHAGAQRRGIRLFRFANVGNHVHLLIQAPSRKAFQAFLREIAGSIAIAVTGARKGLALSKNDQARGFWDHLAFTRIVAWGRDFAGMGLYLVKNLFDAHGVPMKALLARGIRLVSISRDGTIQGAPPGWCELVPV